MQQKRVWPEIGPNRVQSLKAHGLHRHSGWAPIFREQGNAAAVRCPHAFVAFRHFLPRAMAALRDSAVAHPGIGAGIAVLPDMSMTVANGGSVTSVNLAACDGPFNFGIGGPFAPFLPANGSVVLQFPERPG